MVVSAMILGDQVNGSVADMSVIWIDLWYPVNDRLGVGGIATVASEDDAGNEFGMEVDVALKYKFADNINYKLGYGSYSEGDGVASGDVDRTEAFHRLEFTW
jgi:hypothetical protein